jgi:hypothetical protein
MRRDDYDLMGLDAYDEFYTPAMIRDSLIAAGVGAGAILIGAWATPNLPAPEKMTPENQHRMRAAVAAVGGLLIGRGLWDYNRDAAMAVIGGITGLGIAQFVDSFFDEPILGGTPLGVLPEDVELSQGDEALLAAYDNDQYNALSALETTDVVQSQGAFADTTVTPEALFGMGSTMVQEQTLGQYNPYMS